jgi:hypothetical protein
MELNWSQVLKWSQAQGKSFVFSESGAGDGNRTHVRSLGSFCAAPKIRELIPACCQPNPAARPNMQEVLRLLAGASWTDLQAERQQQRIAALCAIGILGLVLVAAAR